MITVSISSLPRAIGTSTVGAVARRRAFDCDCVRDRVRVRVRARIARRARVGRPVGRPADRPAPSARARMAAAVRRRRRRRRVGVADASPFRSTSADPRTRI
jgi:hypothetical protein